jgi:hypothetical protein
VQDKTALPFCGCAVLSAIWGRAECAAHLFEIFLAGGEIKVEIWEEFM